MRNRIFFMVLLFMSMVSISASAKTIKILLGDVNFDKKIDVADITSLYSFILSGTAPSDSAKAAADVNKDNAIDVADITVLGMFILKSDYQYVDLEIEDSIETFTVNGYTFDMIPVEGGTFTMGGTSEQGSDAKSDEKPLHSVTVGDFYMGKFEVTQGLWKAVMGSENSYWTVRQGYGDNYPVYYSSYSVYVDEFLAKLNKLTGKTFRMPTEAEWEYAARGGKKSEGYKYAGSNTLNDVAWNMNNTPMTGAYRTFQPVGTKVPNELGIYDMSGNVSEWCSDYYDKYSSSAQTNPTGATFTNYRVVRGGNANEDVNQCRVSARISHYWVYGATIANYGFRLVMSK